MSFPLFVLFCYLIPNSTAVLLRSISLICSFPNLLFFSTVKWLTQDGTWRHKKPFSQWSGMWRLQVQLSWKWHFLVLESLNTSIKNSPSFWFHCFHWHWKWPAFIEPYPHRWQSREKEGGTLGAAYPCPKQTFWWGSAPPCFGVIIIAGVPG